MQQKSNLALYHFRTALQSMLTQGMCPFVCDGSPLACEIMVVNFNPLYHLKTDFFSDSFWCDDHGLNKQVFLEMMENYQVNKWSRALTLNQYLLQSLKKFTVLETYLYPTPSKRKRDLNSDEKQTQVFEFLLTIIQPKVIIIQNRDVIRFFERNLTISLNRNEFNIVELYGFTSMILPISHVCKKWTFTEAQIITHQIQQILDMIANKVA